MKHVDPEVRQLHTAGHRPRSNGERKREEARRQLVMSQQDWQRWLAARFEAIAEFERRRKAAEPRLFGESEAA